MGHKKRGKFGVKIRPQENYPSVPIKKNRLSTGMKVLIGLAIIAAMVIGSSYAFSGSFSAQPVQTGQSPQASTITEQPYPQNAAPVFYTTPTLTSDGAKLTVPSSFVKSNKLVFVDLKLQTPTETLQYQGRSIPLSIYKGGNYLPLVIISTPAGNTVAGVRTCEPCGSFSFHIVKSSNLRCDACGTEWTLENFTPVSGGCLSYPPPKLTSTANGDNLDIDLSALQVQLAAA